MKSIIAQGAEAIIRKKNNNLIKDRVKKSYRLQILDDKLRKQRTKREVKLLQKASVVIPVPNIISSNNYQIELSFVNGKKLSEHLDKLKNANDVCKKIGNNIARLHDLNIIHGDLTTSNMILKNDEVFLIDFGLGFESKKAEDKAVDLHLIKQALEAKHFKHFESFFSKVLEGYKISKNASIVLERLKKVESRGRYKEQY